MTEGNTKPQTVAPVTTGDNNTRLKLNPVASPFVPRNHPPFPAGTVPMRMGNRVNFPPMPPMLRPPIPPQVLAGLAGQLGFPPGPLMPPNINMQMPPNTHVPPPLRPRPLIILILGEACSGKSTISERLAQEYNLMYFCGARVLQHSANQSKSEWDKRALVIEAIEGMIKDAYAPGCTFRGVVIDRQGKSIDDINYLNAMLRRNSWHLSAVYNCRVKNDSILAQRMRKNDAALEDHTVNERIRASRLLIERCREVYGTPGLWREVDTSGREESIMKHFKNEMTSLAATNTHSSQRMPFYPPPQAPPGESRFLKYIDDVKEYAEILNSMFRVLMKERLNKFPGAVVGKILTNENIGTFGSDKPSSYVFRPIRDGTSYLLYHSGSKVFFVPRHLRCVYSAEITLWKKHRLREFVLEGELVCDPNTASDMFHVNDCLAIQGKSCIKRPWSERQKFISECMIPEESAIPPLPGLVTFVRQLYVDYSGVPDLLKGPGARGVVMCPTGEYHAGIDERMYSWQHPAHMCLDLRVRSVETIRDDECGSCRRVHLDCLDLEGDIARYIDSGVSVEVYDNRVFIAFGHIAEVTTDCNASLADGATRKWLFRRVRYDKSISDTKRRLDNVLSLPPVPEAEFLAFTEKLQAIDQECKKITYKGGDVVRRLMELKQTEGPVVPCKFFLKGRCRHGNACTYSHVDPRKPSSPTAIENALTLDDVEKHDVAELVCGECGHAGAGRVDEQNGAYYCNSCWKAYETGANKQGGKKKAAKQRNTQRQGKQ